MGRVKNTPGWKICSLCVRDEHGKMHRAGDLLYYHDESSDGFLFGIDSLLDMSNRTRESILVFSGDLFFNQKMITKNFKLPNAVFVPDQWHLIKAMKDQIHKRYPCDTKSFFHGMVYARNENDFNQASHSFMEQMKKNGANNDHIDWVKKNLIKKETRHKYSQFELDQIKGTLNFHGSTVCEQNHSSIVSQLGVGYYEEPHKLQKDLNEMTKLVQHNLYRRLTEERRELANLNLQARNSILQASTNMVENESLNLAGYKHFEAEYEKSCYFCKETLNNEKIKIYNRNFPENSVIFDTNEDRCTCSKSVAMMIQCRHEIVLCNNVYDPSRFDIRWKYMSKSTLAKRKAHREEYYLPSEDIGSEITASTLLNKGEKLARSLVPSVRIITNISGNTTVNNVTDEFSRTGKRSHIQSRTEKTDGKTKKKRK